MDKGYKLNMKSRFIFSLSLIVIGFIIGRSTAGKNNIIENASKQNATIQLEEVELSEGEFPKLPLDPTYFNSKDVSWGSAEHHEDFPEGDIRQFNQVALNNKAVYQSYPTTDITQKEFENKNEDLNIRSLQQSLAEYDEDCPMDWPRERAIDNFNKWGSWVTHYLPIYGVDKVEELDVNEDGKNELIVMRNFNCRATSGSYSSEIISEGKIIFTASGDNAAIVEADNNNGFYLEQLLNDSSRCCESGFIRTRFVYENDEFIPVYEQEVKYFLVGEMDN
jgi:hypothetical protein